MTPSVEQDASTINPPWEARITFLKSLEAVVFPALAAFYAA
jgi:hypothetical protein